MWSIFKVFIDFATISFLFYVLVFWPQGMWDLSSPIRDRTHTSCIGKRSPNHWNQEVSRLQILIQVFLTLGASRVVIMVKNLPASVGYIRDQGSIPGSGRSPGGRHGNPLQYSFLEIPQTEEPGRLQCIGLHRVGHDWSDLARMYTGLQNPCMMPCTPPSLLYHYICNNLGAQKALNRWWKYCWVLIYWATTIDCTGTLHAFKRKSSQWWSTEQITKLPDSEVKRLEQISSKLVNGTIGVQNLCSFYSQLPSPLFPLPCDTPRTHRWLRVSVIAENWSCVSKETLSERDGLSVSNYPPLAFQLLSLSTSPVSLHPLQLHRWF